MKARDDEWRLHDVYFYLNEQGWSAGQLWRLAKSTDGGRTFAATTTPAPLPGRPYLNSVTMAGALRGVAVGQGAITNVKKGIVATPPKVLWTDDNTDWRDPTTVTYQYCTSSADYDSVHLWEVAWVRDASNLDFWAVGEEGLVLHSTDGGDNWTQFVPSTQTLCRFQDFDWESVSFFDPSTGFMVGEDTTTQLAAAYRYSSTGTQWTNVPINVSTGSVTILTDVDALDPSTIYAVGEKVLSGGAKEGVLFKWNPTTGSFDEVLTVPECTILDEGEPGVPPTLTVVKALSASSVWLGGQCGRVWHYDGTQLVEHKSQTDTHFWGGASFPSSTRGYFVGERRTLTQTVLVRYKQ